MSAMPDKIKVGDTIDDGEDWNWDDRGYHFVAKLVRDEDSREEDFGDGCCFDLKDKEYGEQNRAIHNAWMNAEWFYFGVVVKAYRCGLELGENSLWGIEGNFTYEGREGPVDNTYFNEVMSECAAEAAHEAKHKIHELMASLLNVEYAPRDQRDDGRQFHQNRRKGYATSTSS